jgi:hypothetical protein
MILPLVLVLAAAPDSYVIVVGNNQSPMLGRPQLAYADDDAVRAAEVFETLLAPSRVELLTELDSDTRRVFPEVELKAQPPRKDAVVAALGAWLRGRQRSAHWAIEPAATSSSRATVTSPTAKAFSNCKMVG